MIKIFNSLATSFLTNAEIFIKDIIEVKETKKKSLNGWYIDVRLPIKYSSYITKDKIVVIKSKSKLNPQAFRIGNQIDEDDYEVSFQAEHVMFDAKRYILGDVRPENKDGAGVLNWINDRTDNISPFIFTSDVETVDTAYFIRKTLLEAMETIEDKWGGIFDADNFNISFNESIGNDNGISVIYGKSSEGINFTQDWSQVCTRIFPVGPNELTLPEEYIDGDIQYDLPYSKTITFESNLDDEASEPEKQNELRNNALIYLEEHRTPYIQYTVKSNVEQSLDIGDTVHVLHPRVNIAAEVQEYVYNPTTKKTLEIVFGNYRKDVKKSFEAIKQQLKIALQRISTQEEVIYNQSELLINLNKSGNFYFDENEALFLDSLPKETAVNVLRIGNGGIGFSTNGINGPFMNAWTIDGFLSATYIKGGVFDGALIKANSIVAGALDISVKEDILSNTSINDLRNSAAAFGTSYHTASGVSTVEDTLSASKYAFLFNNLASLVSNRYIPRKAKKIVNDEYIDTNDYFVSWLVKNELQAGKFRLTVKQYDLNNVLVQTDSIYALKNQNYTIKGLYIYLVGSTLEIIEETIGEDLTYDQSATPTGQVGEWWHNTSNDIIYKYGTSGWESTSLNYSTDVVDGVILPKGYGRVTEIMSSTGNAYRPWQGYNGEFAGLDYQFQPDGFWIREPNTLKTVQLAPSTGLEGRDGMSLTFKLSGGDSYIKRPRVQEIIIDDSFILRTVIKGTKKVLRVYKMGGDTE